MAFRVLLLRLWLARLRRLPIALAAAAIGVGSPLVAPVEGDAAAVPITFDGWVSHIADGGQYTYVAGSFTKQVQATGSGVPLPVNGADQDEPRAFGRVGGPVHDVEPDGKGGWYIAGDFRRVGDVERPGLARIRADGTVDPVFTPPVARDAYPGTVSTVRRVVAYGGVVYIAGDFVEIGGKTRPGLAALDHRTGRTTDWAPSIEGGSKLRGVTRLGVLVERNVAAPNEDPRRRYAMIDLRTGDVSPWGEGRGFPDAGFAGMLVTRDAVYVWGPFSSINGRRRLGLAALDAKSGAVTPWDPAPFHPRGTERGWVDSLAVRGRTVYVAGRFTRVGGQRRAGLAALDVRTGRPTSWNPPRHRPATILAVSERRVHVTERGRGRFDQESLSAFSRRTGERTRWRYQLELSNGGISDAAIAGDQIYVGGRFTRGRRPLARLRGVARLHSDGSLDTAWHPRLSQKGARPSSVSTVVTSKRAVYIAGTFDTVEGRRRAGLAALRATTGGATPWNPKHDGVAVPLAAVPGHVFLAGNFTTIDGQPRRHLASVHDVTGRVTAWNPRPDGPLFDAVPAGDQLYVSGGFSRIGGQARSGVAVLRMASAQATPWSPTFSRTPGEIPGSLAVSNAGVFVVMGRTGEFIPSAVLKLDLTTGALLQVASFDGQAGSLAPSPTAVYVAGEFYDPPFLAAIDAQTGAKTSWTPRPTARGDTAVPMGTVEFSHGHVYVAGGMRWIGDTVAETLARVDPATGRATPITLRQRPPSRK